MSRTPSPALDPAAIVVMGVAGAGKTTVGQALATHCGYAFVDGDALHPAANIAKMSAGQPLTDADRAPWLAKVADWMDARLAEGRSGVVTCSALKRKYRDELTLGRPAVRLVLLDGSRELIEARVAKRTGHFWPPGLLETQFADFEPPGPDEAILVIDVAPPVDIQVAEIVERLALTPAAA
ncbi:gluconokinase [Phenylobacterium sp.]|uniref:gluconokinase n=1 Tax=Phenylobacterium sp. TaxID=1871053 RepID=UPI0011FCA441|nr:gluconokinase [Phenylobacterium sp.]THD70971.1 MAG: gluconokinase [Phenylobacterium sp.]